MSLVGIPFARASSPLPQLQVYRAPDAVACPDAGQLTRAVHALIGRPAFDLAVSPAAPVVFEVQIQREGVGYSASVHVRGATEGARRIHDDTPGTCAGLADALTVTLALILDTLEAPAYRTRASSLPPPTTPSPAPQSAWKLSAGVDAAASAGILHAMRPAGMAAADFTNSDGYGLGAGFLFVGSDSFAYPPGHIDLGLWAVLLRGCAVLTTAATIRFSGCLVPAAGAVRGSARGFSANASATRPWVALGGEIASQGRLLPPVDWTVRTLVLVPAREESFSIDGIGVAYRPQPVGGLLAAGLRASFW